ncbi:MAG TPA: hypothetical protein VIO61_16170 [Anaerolineaceae bacterium]
MDLVKNGFLTHLTSRHMPDVKIENAEINNDLLSKNFRTYSITTISPGVTTITYIAKHGSDLFASWRSFIRPTINWKLMEKYAYIAVILGMIYSLLLSILDQIRIVSMVFSYVKSNNAFINAFVAWILYGLGIFLIELLILTIYRNIRKNISVNMGCSVPILIIIALGIALFFNTGKILFPAVKTIFTMTSTPFFTGIFMLIQGIGAAFSVFTGIIILTMPVGFVTKRNLFAFILNEPGIFDVEDILGMNLSVHKSLLRALDEAGIKSSTLRTKQDFKSGHHNEKV